MIITFVGPFPLFSFPNKLELGNQLLMDSNEFKLLLTNKLIYWSQELVYWSTQKCLQVSKTCYLCVVSEIFKPTVQCLWLQRCTISHFNPYNISFLPFEAKFNSRTCTFQDTNRQICAFFTHSNISGIHNVCIKST